MSVQFIKSARKGKPVTWYVYAYKGAPRLFKHVGPKKPKLTADQWKAVAEAQEKRGAPDSSTLNSLIWEWRSRDPSRPSSKNWDALADGTKALWGAELDRISERWGDKPLSVWADARMKGKVVIWRDSRAMTPRQADVGIQALKALLKFGQLMGRLSINVAEDIPQLYKGGNREEIVWTADDMERFRLAAVEDEAEHIHDGLRLAALTGLRRQDLVSLTWAQVGEFAIVKKALKKSQGKRRRVSVPMTPKLEALLAELKARPRKEGVETVLVNSRGVPWTGMGFGTSFNRIRNLAKISHIDQDDGTERAKHLHDVRGTFCTFLLTECDLTDREAADIMAWSPERVARIRKVYVDDSRVVVAIGKRIAAKQIAKQSV